MTHCGIWRARKAVKKPTAASLDSQSVRTAGHAGIRGHDAGKKCLEGNDTCCYTATDSFLGISATGASVQDRGEARDLLSRVLVGGSGWVRRIWADGGDVGQLVDDIACHPRHRKMELGIVKRSDLANAFKVLSKRWMVQRTFGWLVRMRRLIRDFEVIPEYSVAMNQVAMTMLMLRGIAFRVIFRTGSIGDEPVAFQWRCAGAGKLNDEPRKIHHGFGFSIRFWK
jgi:putative transposase